MSLEKNTQKIRIGVAIAPADDPSEAAEMAIKLADLPCFDVRIVGCGMPSVFDFPPSAPMMGIPMPSFMIEHYIKTRLADIKETCKKIICSMNKRLPRNSKPEVCYINGPLNQLAPTLISMFDVIALPHLLNLTMKFRICRPILDRLLIKSQKVPILFGVDFSTCWRIVVAQIDTYSEPQAEQVISFLAESLHVPVYRWLPKKSIVVVNSTENIEQKLAGIPDSHELDDNTVFADQCGTLLVIPSSVFLRRWRFRKVRRMLQNWWTNCLVLA